MRFDYNLIKDDYLPNDMDDDRLRNVKDAIMELTPAERKIFLTYVETESYAATAREYNVSAPTAKAYILTVKNKIERLMNNGKSDSDNAYCSPNI